MNNLELDRLLQHDKPNAVSLFCMASLVADEASRHGFSAFAKTMENALTNFLAELPRDAQKRALRLSYEMALGTDDPAPPRLRLVYSRD